MLSSYSLCHLCREPVLFVLQMDLGNTYQNFINIVSATYVYDSDDDSSNYSEEAPNSQNNSSAIQSQANDADDNQENQEEIEFNLVQNPVISC